MIRPRMSDDAVTRPIATEGRADPTEADLSEHVEVEQHATPLELFFDLVFVFAFTQVTGLMSENPTWEGLGQGMLVLAAVWWAWGGYAWMTNALHRDDWLARLGLFSAMAAMLIAALAVPEAFGDDAVIFGLAYFAVRAIHIAVYAYGAEEDDVSGAILNLAPGLLAAPALLVIAGFLDGGAQAGLWIVALLIDYGTPYVRDVSGFRVSASHFAERFGLIVIIALGESIVAIGAGLERRPADRRGDRRRAGRDLARDRAVVDVLRRGRDRRRAQAGRRRGDRAKPPRARLLGGPARSPDRRDHPHRARGQEDDRRRRRAARDGAGGRALRWSRPLPVRPRRDPAGAASTRSTASGSSPAWWRWP